MKGERRRVRHPWLAAPAMASLAAAVVWLGVSACGDDRVTEGPTQDIGDAIDPPDEASGDAADPPDGDVASADAADGDPDSLDSDGSEASDLAGDTDVSALDRTPPRLLSVTPPPTTDVARDARFELTFSEPVANPEAIVLRVDGLAVATDVTTQAEGAVVSVTPAAAAEAPSRLTLSIDDVVDSAGNGVEPSEPMRWFVPVWLNRAVPVGEVSVVDVDGAATPAGLAVLYRDAAGDAGFGLFEPAGGFVALASPAATRVSALALGRSQGVLSAALVTDEGLELTRFDGAAWTGLPGPALGEPVLSVAWASDGVLVYRTADALGIHEVGPQPQAPTCPPLTLAASDAVQVARGAPVTAVSEGAAGLSAHRCESGVWASLPVDAPRDPDLTVQHPRPALDDQGRLTIATALTDELGRHVVAVASDMDGAGWVGLGMALDAEAERDALPADAITTGGRHVVAFVQDVAPGMGRLFVSVFRDGRWTRVGRPFDVVKGAAEPRLVVSDEGGLSMLWAPAGGGLRVALYQAGSEGPARGLPPVSAWGACTAGDLDAIEPGTPLSSLSIYQDAGQQRVDPAAIPYDLNSRLWSDATFKRRFILLPEGAQTAYRDTGSWDFPACTVVVKEFWYETTPGDPRTRRIVETRLLVRRDVDPIEWQPFNFAWNDAQSEAFARPDVAEWAAYPLDDGGSYEHFFPARIAGLDACNACHADPAPADEVRANRLLGVQSANLNRDFDYADGADNQLRALVGAGVLVGAPAGLPAAAPRWPRPADPMADFASRARSYLEANCTHCHRSGGAAAHAVVGPFTLTLAETGICENWRALPGDHANSQLYTRPQARFGVRMPPVGTAVPDPVHEYVFRRWIDGMQSCP